MLQLLKAVVIVSGMKLSFNDLHRVIKMLEACSKEPMISNPEYKQRRDDFATAATILRVGICVELIPDPVKEVVDFPEPPKERYYTNPKSGGFFRAIVLNENEEFYVRNGIWKEITMEQGMEWHRTGKIIGVYEP